VTTTLIQQKSGSDCVLAAIAMAAGKEKWEDLWTQADLDQVIKDRGVGDIDPWMQRAGFQRGVHYHETYSNYEPVAKKFLWKRKALLSIDSLNIAGGMHMVYWDGDRIFDPHDSHDSYLFHRIITGVSLYKAFLLNL